MKATLKKENDNQEVLEQLDFYAQKAAEGLRPYLKNADLEGYKRFLNVMYHYTLTSGDKLKGMEETSPNQELKDYFHHMYLEERNHYMLAQQDLRGFGLLPNEETPQAVQDFNNFWASLKGKHINAYLGALYVFENVAEKVGDEVKEMLIRLNIEKSQKRWVAIHVEVDVSHGAEIAEVLKRYIDQNPGTALEAAKEACERWIAVVAVPFAK